MRLLFGTLRYRNSPVFYPAARFLLDGQPLLDALQLPLLLEEQRALDSPEGVHVLDFDFRPERIANSAHADVRVAAECPLFHVSGRDTDVAQDLAQCDQVVTCLFSGPQIRFPDNFHQWHAGAVEINQADLRAASVNLVDQAPGVLLDVHACNASALFLARGDELQRSIDAQRQVVLRDLVPLGQVRVHVILAVHLAVRRDLAVQRQSRQHCCFHGRPVHHWQRAGKSPANEADMSIWLGVRVARRASTVHLGLGQKLSVNLEADDDFVRGCGLLKNWCAGGQVSPRLLGPEPCERPGSLPPPAGTSAPVTAVLSRSRGKLAPD